ncbi:MAG: hypothetical protein ACRC80_26640 [Waterburya sp.]
MKIQSYKKETLERFKTSFRKSAEVLNGALKDTISQPRDWDGFQNRLTIRQNGEIVQGSFRNIVDLGNLRDSQKLEIQQDKATITWDGKGETPVVDVFFGKRTDNDFIPGRNWVEPTLQEIDLAKEVQREFNANTKS